LNTEQQHENRRESTSQETSGGDEKQTAQLRNTIKDLNEKLETLKLKRAEDREKLREFEKLKLQNQQVYAVDLKINLCIHIFSNLFKFIFISSCKTSKKKLRRKYLI